MKLPPAILLMGPTASGKTALAFEIADRFPVDLISVDSAQVFRDMNIGTAKPDAATLARYPHRLVDLISPEESYSAARFRTDALAAMAAITAAGRVPLLVGGTMLYFKALREGLADLPDANPELRAQIDAEAELLGWPALHQELALLDPETAARLAPNDAQRIQRALEVWRTSGRSLSDWHGPAADRAARGHASRWPLLSLEPLARAWLHERIAQRCAQMFDDGLIDEVCALKRRGDLHPDLPSMRCVGYRQVWASLDRGADGAARAEVVAATRQLAKRQLSWLRSTTDRHVVVCDNPQAREQALETLRTWSRHVPRGA